MSKQIVWPKAWALPHMSHTHIELQQGYVNLLNKSVCRGKKIRTKTGSQNWPKLL